MKITSITRTIRNTRRVAEIIKVLTKFGIRQLVQDTGRIQCPRDLMLLTKALTTIEGVATYFDPTFAG